MQYNVGVIKWGAFHSTKIIRTNFLNFRWSNGTRLTASQNSRSPALQHRACWVKLCCYSKCPHELTLGRGLKPTALANETKFWIIPEIPSRRVHSTRIPKISKTFPVIFIVAFNFRPEILEVLVEWKARMVSPKKKTYTVVPQTFLHAY